MSGLGSNFWRRSLAGGALLLFWGWAGAAYSQDCRVGAPTRNTSGRFVTCVNRIDNTIVSVGDVGAPWSPRSRECVASDIDSGAASYFVDLGNADTGLRYRLEAYSKDGQRFLRARANDRKYDNLEALPSCPVV